MPTIDPFKVAPNPTDESVQISSPPEWESKVYIQLINMQGKLVKQYTMQERIYTLEMDENVSPGQYFLNFYQESGIFIQQIKLIKIDKQ